MLQFNRILEPRGVPKSLTPVVILQVVSAQVSSRRPMASCRWCVWSSLGGRNGSMEVPVVEVRRKVLERFKWIAKLGPDSMRLQERNQGCPGGRTGTQRCCQHKTTGWDGIQI
jgi:hypothetical protein